MPDEKYRHKNTVIPVHGGISSFFGGYKSWISSSCVIINTLSKLLIVSSFGLILKNL